MPLYLCQCCIPWEGITECSQTQGIKEIGESETIPFIQVYKLFLKMKDLISDKAGREDLKYFQILINGLPFYEETP